jgi:hypothetical protein
MFVIVPEREEGKVRLAEPIPYISIESLPALVNCPRAGAVFCSFGAFEDRGFFALPGESPGPINL